MSNATAVPARPVAADYKPISELRTIDEALKHPGIIQRFQQAVPQHLSTDRMLRVCSMAVFNTPELGKCDMMSLLGAMLQLASLGLEPNTPLGHAYLIPFKARRKDRDSGRWSEYVTVQVVIGYRGLIDLARRSGNMVSIHADVVYEGDDFEFEYGSNMHLRHRPTGTGRNPQWAYAHASLKDGQAFEVLPYGKVLNIRNNSQGYRAALAAKKDHDADPSQNAWKLKTWESSPWVAHEHEMASKTLIRRIAKYLPMSIEFMRAVDLDTLSEDRVLDFASVMHAPAQQQADILEHLPSVDEEPEAAAAQPQQQQGAGEGYTPPTANQPQPSPTTRRGRPPGSTKKAQPAQEAMTLDPKPVPEPEAPKPEPQPDPAPAPEEPQPEPLPEAASGEVVGPPTFSLWCWNGEKLELFDYDIAVAEFCEEVDIEMQKAMMEGGTDLLDQWVAKNEQIISGLPAEFIQKLNDKRARWAKSLAKKPATVPTPKSEPEAAAGPANPYV